MMKTSLCETCELHGYCRRLTSWIVMPRELTPTFIGDVRRFMAAMQLSRDAWVPYLIGSYRDYPGRIMHPSGLDLRLNTHLLAGKSVRYWYRDLCEPIPEGTTPHVRIEARGRFIVLASILLAMHPISALTWGKGSPPVDDGGVRPFPSTANDECPYRLFVIVPWGGKSRKAAEDSCGFFGGIPPFLG